MRFPRRTSKVALAAAGVVLLVLAGAGVWTAGVLKSTGDASSKAAFVAPTTANLWVDTSGGTCTRQTTPADYVDAAACGSLDAAYQAASPGDTIIVQGGAYPCESGTVTAKPGAAPPNIQMFTPDGQTPSFLGCQVGINPDDWNGSYLTITGHFKWSAMQIHNSTNLTLDGVEIDAGHTFENALVVQCATSNFTMRNSSIHNNWNGWLVGIVRCAPGATPNGVTFDHVNFYDNRMPNNGTNHLECLGDWGGDNLTITNSNFWHCTTFDVFLTTSNDGTDYPVHNVTLENNTFADDFINGTDGGCCAGISVKWLTGNPNSGRWGNIVIRHNTFEGLLYLANGNTGSTLTVVGNQFASDVDICATGTFAYNVGDGCGTTDVQSTSAAITGGWVTDNPTSLSNNGDDYHLKPSSPAVGRGEPAPDPAADQDGNTRKSPSDAGAFELGGTPPPPTTTTTPTTTAPPPTTTVPGDTTPPVVSWVRPLDGATISGTLGDANCEASATDNVGVDHVDFLIDGNPVNTERTAPYTCGLDTTTVPDGQHVLKATAFDGAGNNSSVSVTVTINNTAVQLAACRDKLARINTEYHSRDSTSTKLTRIHNIVHETACAGFSP